MATCMNLAIALKPTPWEASYGIPETRDAVVHTLTTTGTGLTDDLFASFKDV